METLLDTPFFDQVMVSIMNAIKKEGLESEKRHASKLSRDREMLKFCAINLSSKLEELTPHKLILFYYRKKFAPNPPLPDCEKFRLDILHFVYIFRWRWY